LKAAKAKNQFNLLNRGENENRDERIAEIKLENHNLQ